ncbi:hypothetical protein [Actinomarinicola tropica]|uniref:Uncharacterized protein n=1 Tax=Actinomarinicola tropica TaxID=2789776 RepID=A0A5Q2RLU6_9ACTN|nr:hypothetical protein [Actinomarinicola tropica]QGG95902.1 hypothetical protein GH723_12790 [Actinomarinicola tropica]
MRIRRWTALGGRLLLIGLGAVAWAVLATVVSFGQSDVNGGFFGEEPSWTPRSPIGWVASVLAWASWAVAATSLVAGAVVLLGALVLAVRRAVAPDDRIDQR